MRCAYLLLSTLVVTVATTTDPVKFSTKMSTFLVPLVMVSPLIVSTVATTTTDPVEFITKISSGKEDLKEDTDWAGNNFGSSTAIDGDYAIVGIYGDQNNRGAAHILTKDSNGSWKQIQKLIACDGVTGDEFGVSIGISGDIVVIGARYNDGRGAAYTYFKSNDGTFSEAVKLVGDDGASGDQFGYAVDVSGDWIFVGAWLDDDNGSDSGSVYCFFVNSDRTISQKQKLTAFDGASYDYFGRYLAISEGRAIISANQDDDKGAQSGSASFFALSTNGTLWYQTTKVTASDGNAVSGFSMAVDIDGSQAFVGAYKSDNHGTNSGSAFFFNENHDGSWTESSAVYASDVAAYDRFGSSVSISFDHAIVSAPQNDDQGTDSGTIYSFSKNHDDGSWSQTSKTSLDDGAAYDYFGNPVALFNGTALISAMYSDEYGADSGSVHSFLLEEDGTFSYKQKITQYVAAYDYFGDAVAITPTASATIIGAKGDGFTYDSTAHAYYKTWSNVAELTPTNTTNIFYFGAAVGITGTSSTYNAVVGAPGGETGTAFVFTDESGDWSQESQLIPNSSTAVGPFGHAVAISSTDYILVGAPGLSLTSTGSAFIFKKNITWNQVAELQPTSMNFYFGGAVALSGSTGIIGAEGSETAYIIEKDENEIWSIVAKLTASDLTISFGRAVAISPGETLCVIGAPESNCAYVFAKVDGQWTQQAKLTTSESSTEFGYAVALTDLTVIVSDSEDAVFVFSETSSGTWSKVSSITAPSNAPSNSTFGYALAIAEDTLVVGNRADDTADTDLGSVYFYSVEQTSYSSASSQISCASDYDCPDGQSCYYLSRRRRRLRRRHVLFAPYTDPGVCA